MNLVERIEAKKDATCINALLFYVAQYKKENF
jgi:hypothetical protein